ncbi:MAG TPA: alpha/beta fold hydrolase [Xanthobacteraceae bacterium]|nr:alpha/beta fold hydrolase [Xanthobacteraceae bacterium]
MSEPKESYETIAGCKVQMLRGGKGAPLLFLHGGGGAGVWLPFFKSLAEKFEVIVPEHPGFGRSNMPDWLDNVGDFANFYLEFMDKLGLTGVNLVGTSLGGWIAADLAVRDSGPLRTLTLVAPAGIHVQGVPKGDIFLWTPEQTVRNLFADPAMVEMALKRTPDEEERRRQMKNALTMAKVGWQPRLYDPHLRKWLHRIEVPTLIVWGDSDKVIPPAYGPAYRDLIPGSRLEILKSCGHLPHIEKGAETVALVTKFIEEAK